MKARPVPIVAALLALASAAASAAVAAEPLPGLFELRVYEAGEGKLEALHRRFREHTLALFERHGMVNVAYWTPRTPSTPSTPSATQEEGKERLVFLLAYPDREARERSWAAFLEDPEWKRVFAESNREGDLVAAVESRLLVPTDYSPGLPEMLAGGEGRQFEMRTYTTHPGKLEAIDARFRDHTVALFERHGMANLPYFHLEAGQEGAETTLLYFLAHESDEARQASFAAFREDPDWIAAREASESGSPILVQGGVESLLLEATDYSPLK